MAVEAGEKILAADAQNLQVARYYAIGSGTLAGPQSNADVTSATVTFTTLTDGATYAAWAVVDVDLTGATTATGTARIAVDGTVQSPLIVYGQEVATDRLTVGQNYAGTLATAGSHTIKIVASPAASQQIQGVNSSILVLVFENV